MRYHFQRLIAQLLYIIRWLFFFQKKRFSLSLQNKGIIIRINQTQVRLHHLFSTIDVKFRSFSMHINTLHKGIITKISQTRIRLYHLFSIIDVKFRSFFMHIYTHVVCNAHYLNFKFKLKLKLNRVKLIQVSISSSILLRTKIKFSCESLYFKFLNV